MRGILAWRWRTRPSAGDHGESAGSPPACAARCRRCTCRRSRRLRPSSSPGAWATARRSTTPSSAARTACRALQRYLEEVAAWLGKREGAFEQGRLHVGSDRDVTEGTLVAHLRGPARLGARRHRGRAAARARGRGAPLLLDAAHQRDARRALAAAAAGRRGGRPAAGRPRTSRRSPAGDVAGHRRELRGRRHRCATPQGGTLRRKARRARRRTTRSSSRGGARHRGAQGRPRRRRPHVRARVHGRRASAARPCRRRPASPCTSAARAACSTPSASTKTSRSSLELTQGEMTARTPDAREGHVGKFSLACLACLGVLAVSLSMLTVVLAACGSCSSSHGSGSGDDGGAEAAVEAGPSPSQACAGLRDGLLRSARGVHPVRCCRRPTATRRPAPAASPSRAARPSRRAERRRHPRRWSRARRPCRTRAATRSSTTRSRRPATCRGPSRDAGACGVGRAVPEQLLQDRPRAPSAERAPSTWGRAASVRSTPTARRRSSATGGSCIGPAAAGADLQRHAAVPADAHLHRRQVRHAGRSERLVRGADGLRRRPRALLQHADEDVRADAGRARRSALRHRRATPSSRARAGPSCANISQNQGTCHQPAADGAACGPGIGCMAPAVCTSTARCTLPNPSVCH